jgi:hypothetical protein
MMRVTSLVRSITILLAVLGAMIAVAAAGLMLSEEVSFNGTSVFPLPFLVLFEWGVLGMAGAVYVTLSELQWSDHHPQVAWGILGAYVPLIFLGAFSLGLLALISALPLVAATVIMTIRRRLSAFRCLGMMTIGALANLAILFGLIGLNALSR